LVSLHGPFLNSLFDGSSPFVGVPPPPFSPMISTPSIPNVGFFPTGTALRERHGEPPALSFPCCSPHARSFISTPSADGEAPSKAALPTVKSGFDNRLFYRNVIFSDLKSPKNPFILTKKSLGRLLFVHMPVPKDFLLVPDFFLYRAVSAIYQSLCPVQLMPCRSFWVEAFFLISPTLLVLQPLYFVLRRVAGEVLELPGPLDRAPA